MNIEAYNLIIDKIKPLLDGRGFKTVDTETGSYFENGEIAVRVIFKEKEKLFCLEKCELSDDKKPSDWSLISEWLFEDGTKASYASSIGGDFEDTLREALGIKPTANRQAALPSKAKKNDQPTVKSLTGSFLTVFPQYKNEYPKYVTEDGAFLYAEFYETVGAPLLKELLRANDKKRLQKYFDMLDEAYRLGDLEVRSVVSTCVLAQALKGEKALTESALGYLKDKNYLALALKNSLAIKK